MTNRLEQVKQVKKSRLSVVTMNFNDGATLGRTIESVAKQTRPVLEHIVVDDASTDDSVQIVQRLQKKYPLVRLITSKRNSGTAAAGHRGLLEAKGDYVFFLAADDFIMPTATENLLAVADAATAGLAIMGTNRPWARRHNRGRSPSMAMASEVRMCRSAAAIPTRFA